MFILYFVIFSPKSVIKYIFFCEKMKRLHRSLTTTGYDDFMSLKMISSLLHPELGDIVHDEIAVKFNRLSEVVTFIYWGMDKYSNDASKISDEVALAIVRAGRIHETSKKVIIDNKLITEELLKIKSSQTLS